MTRRGRRGRFCGGFQSTSPVWGMTEISSAYSATQAISIHIPRVGDDDRADADDPDGADFNPHPPCGG